MKSVNRRHRFMIRLRRLRAWSFAKTCQPAPFIFTTVSWHYQSKKTRFSMFFSLLEFVLSFKRIANASCCRCCDRKHPYRMTLYCLAKLVPFDANHLADRTRFVVFAADSGSRQCELLQRTLESESLVQVRG